MVEGGPTLIGSLLRTGLVQRGVAYVAAKLAGGTGRPVAAGPFATLADARDTEVVSVSRVGPDVRIEFRVAGGS
jgi:diaminohydroxyphosphoribosylaminopyrimidine deaminase/5-amino-6-(5-phosphoribosylamino)uracil reductase